MVKTGLLQNGFIVRIHGDSDDPYFQGFEGHIAGLRSMLCVAISSVVDFADIYDIGANIGLSTIMLSKQFPNSKIVAMEASPRNCEFLRLNIEANSCENVEVVATAVSDSEGSLSFHESNYGAGSHVVSDEHIEQEFAKLRVPKTTLDKIWAGRKRAVSFCKMDVEGHEPNVFAGAEAMMTENKPQIFMEFNSWCLNGFGGHSPTRFAKTLMSKFSLRYVDENGTTSPILRAIDLVHRNMVRDGCVTDLVAGFNKGVSYARPSEWLGHEAT